MHVQAELFGSIAVCIQNCAGNKSDSSPKFNLSTHHSLSSNRFLSLKKFETDFNITFIHQGRHHTSLIILNLISQILHRLTLVKQIRQKLYGMQHRSESVLDMARRWQIPLEHHISCRACLEKKVFPAVHATSTLPWVCFHYARSSHVPTTYTSLLEYWLPMKHTWEPHFNSIKALDIPTNTYVRCWCTLHTYHFRMASFQRDFNRESPFAEIPQAERQLTDSTYCIHNSIKTNGFKWPARDTHRLWMASNGFD